MTSGFAYLLKAIDPPIKKHPGLSLYLKLYRAQIKFFSNVMGLGMNMLNKFYHAKIKYFYSNVMGLGINMLHTI